MGETTTRLYPIKARLKELETTINADEAVGLTLEALGHTKNRTAATYDIQDPPNDGVQLFKIPEGTVSVPAGLTPICVGYVWIESEPARVLAAR